MKSLVSGYLQSFQDVGNDMGRTDQVDIMAAFRLESEHHPRQLLFTDRIALAELAYGVILTEDTPEVAPGEKDSARTISPDQRSFLAKVRTVTGDHNLTGNLTLPFLIG
jgi:hypothetical protein